MIGYRRQTVVAVAVIGSAFAIDQLTKYLLPTVFLNSTLSFGIPVPQTAVFIVITLAGLVLVIRSLSPITYNLAPSLILAGGVSNLLDRFLFGGVRDIFTVGTLYFNVADLCIVGGLAAIAYGTLRYGYATKRVDPRRL